MVRLSKKYNQVTYRKAVAEDVHSLVEFRIRFLSGYPQTIKGTNVEPLKLRLAEYFKRTIYSGEFIAFIAENGGEIVGVAYMIRWQFLPGFDEKTESRGYIFNVYTVPEMRGRGIASSLVSLLIEEAKSLGIGYLNLHATKNAEGIYRKIGFTEHWDKEMVLRLA